MRLLVVYTVGAVILGVIAVFGLGGWFLVIPAGWILCLGVGFASFR